MKYFVLVNIIDMVHMSVYLQSGYECFCGNIASDIQSLNKAFACNFTCPGNSSEACGGSSSSGTYMATYYSGIVQLHNTYFVCSLILVRLIFEIAMLLNLGP